MGDAGEVLEIVVTDDHERRHRYLAEAPRHRRVDLDHLGIELELVGKGPAEGVFDMGGGDGRAVPPELGVHGHELVDVAGGGCVLLALVEGTSGR